MLSFLNKTVTVFDGTISFHIILICCLLSSPNAFGRFIKSSVMLIPHRKRHTFCVWPSHKAIAIQFCLLTIFPLTFHFKSFLLPFCVLPQIRLIAQYVIWDSLPCLGPPFVISWWVVKQHSFSIKYLLWSSQLNSLFRRVHSLPRCTVELYCSRGDFCWSCMSSTTLWWKQISRHVAAKHMTPFGPKSWDSQLNNYK
jgi:hypothetical protein